RSPSDTYAGGVSSGLFGYRRQHAAAHLVQLHGFKQGLEVAFTKTLIALALDELEEDRAELVLAEDLKQQFARMPVHQDVSLLQGFHVLAMAWNALVEQLVVGVTGVEQFHTAELQCVDGVVEVGRAHGDVLDALAVVAVKVLLNLAGLLVAFFVDGNADLAAGAGHGLALDAGG